MKIFFYSSVYSWHLFFISSASVRSISFLSFYCAHLCMKCSLGISNFLEEIFSLSHSIVFLYFFALITEEGFLISSWYLLPLLGPYHFCLYHAHLYMKCSLSISNFLEEIYSLSHSIVFLYLFALITEECFLSLLAILWISAFKWVYLSFSPLPLYTHIHIFLIHICIYSFSPL